MAGKEEKMEQIILDALGKYAFPIIMCLVMAWYVKYQTDNNRTDINELNKLHREEMLQITSAINNNTLALQKLTDFITENYGGKND